MTYVENFPTFGDDFEGPDFSGKWNVRDQTGPVSIRQEGGALVMSGTATESETFLSGQVVSAKSFAATDFEAQATVLADISAPPDPTVPGWYQVNIFFHGGSGGDPPIHAGISCFQGVSGDPASPWINAACNPVTGPTGDPSLSQPVLPFLGRVITLQIAYSASTQTASIAVPELGYSVEGIPTGAVDPSRAVNFELSGSGFLFPGQSYRVEWLDFQTNLGGGDGYVASRTAFERNGISYSEIPEGGPGPVYVTQAGLTTVGQEGTFIPSLTGEEDLNAFLIAASFVDAGITIHLTMFSPFTREQLFQLLPVQPGLEITLDAEFPSVWLHQGARQPYLFVMPEIGEPRPSAPRVVSVVPGFNPVGYLRPRIGSEQPFREKFEDKATWWDEFIPIGDFITIPNVVLRPEGTTLETFLTPTKQPGLIIQSAGQFYTEHTNGLAAAATRRFFTTRTLDAQVTVQPDFPGVGGIWFGTSFGTNLEGLNIFCIDLKGPDFPLEAGGYCNAVRSMDEPFNIRTAHKVTPSLSGRRLTLILSFRDGLALARIPELEFARVVPFSPTVTTTNPNTGQEQTHERMLPIVMMSISLNPGRVRWDNLLTGQSPTPKWAYEASVTPLALDDQPYQDVLLAAPAFAGNLTSRARIGDPYASTAPEELRDLFNDVIGKFTGLKPGPAAGAVFLSLAQTPGAPIEPGLLSGVANMDNAPMDIADGITPLHALLLRFVDLDGKVKRVTMYVASPIDDNTLIAPDEPLLLLNPDPEAPELRGLDAVVLNVFTPILDSEGTPTGEYRFRLPRPRPKLAAIAVPSSVTIAAPPEGSPPPDISTQFPAVCVFEDQTLKLQFPEFGPPPGDPFQKLFQQILFSRFCQAELAYTYEPPGIVEIVIDPNSGLARIEPLAIGETRVTARLTSPDDAEVPGEEHPLSNVSTIRIVQGPPVNNGTPGESSEPDLLQFVSVSSDRFNTSVHVPQTVTPVVKVRPAFPVDLNEPLFTCQSVHLQGNASIEGDIRANVGIVLQGSPEIAGNARYGPGGEIVQTGKAAKITGSVTQASDVIDCAPMGKALAHLAASINPDQNRGTLRLTGREALTLEEGVHVFDSIDLTGRSVLTTAPGAQVIVNTVTMSGTSKVEGQVEWFLPSGTVEGPPPPPEPSGLTVAEGGTERAYLNYVGPETFPLIDEFNDIPFTENWIAGGPTAGGTTQQDGHLRMVGGGFLGHDGPAIVISKYAWPPLAGESTLSMQTDMVLEVVDAFNAGTSPSETMSSGILLSKSQPGDPSFGGALLMVGLLGGDPDNPVAFFTTGFQGVDIQEMRPIASAAPGQRFHLEMSYQHATRTIEALVQSGTNVHETFSINVGSTFADGTPVTPALFVGMRDITLFDRVETNLQASLSPFVASRSPLALNGTPYTDITLFVGAPEGFGSIFLLPGVVAGPGLVFVTEDNTRIDVDGTSDIHAALFTLLGGCDAESPPTTQRVTLYTPFDESILQGFVNECNLLDHFEASIFVANGPEASYTWTLEPPAPPDTGTVGIEPPTEPSVLLTGNALFNGFMVAPKATVTVSGSAVFNGALVSGHYVGEGSSKTTQIPGTIPKRILIPFSGSAGGGSGLALQFSGDYRAADFGEFGTDQPSYGPVVRHVSSSIQLSGTEIPDGDGFITVSLPYLFEARDDDGFPLPTSAYRLDASIELSMLGTDPSATEALATVNVQNGVVTVDHDAPGLTLLVPSEDGALTNRSTLSVITFTDDPASSGDVFVNGIRVSPSPSFPMRGLAYLSDPFNPPTLLQGSNDLRVVARDPLGNQREVSLAITRDSLPPSIHFVTPRDGVPTNEQSTLVSFVVTDLEAPPRRESIQLIRASALDRAVQNVEIESCEELTLPGPDGNVMVLACSALAELSEGMNSFRVSAFDDAGNGSGTSVAIKADWTPPKADIFSVPDGTCSTTAPPAYAFQLRDPEPSGRMFEIGPSQEFPEGFMVELPAKGFIGPLASGMDLEEFMLKAVGSARTFILSHGPTEGPTLYYGTEVSTLPEDGYVQDVRVEDYAGNVGGGQTKFFIDRTPPKVVVEHYAPSTPGDEKGLFVLNLSDLTLEFTYKDVPPPASPLAEPSGLVFDTFEASIQDLTGTFVLGGPIDPEPTPLEVPLVREEPGRTTIPLSLPDGFFRVEAAISDCPGNRGVGFDEIFIDTKAPLPLVIEPANGVFVNSSRPVFKIQCGDPYPSGGVAFIDLTIHQTADADRNPVDVTQLIRALEGPEKCVSPTSLVDVPLPEGVELQEGLYEISVLLTDRGTNQGTSPVSHFGVDVTPPRLEFVRNHRAFDNRNPISIEAGVSDSLSGFWSGYLDIIDDQGEKHRINPTSFADIVLLFRIPTLQFEGQNWVRFVLADRAGNESVSQAYSLVRDWTPPQAHLDPPDDTNQPLPPTSISIFAVPFRPQDPPPPLDQTRNIAIRTASGLASVSLSVDEVPIDYELFPPFANDLTQVTRVMAEVPLFGTSLGPHNITAALTDRAGNTQDLRHSYCIDPHPPLINVLRPHENEYIRTSTFKLQVAVDDGDLGCGIETPVIEPVDSITNVTFDGETLFADVKFPEGANTVAVRTRDRAGNESEPETRTITVDYSPPIITFHSPEDGDRAETELCIHAEIEDLGTQVQTVDVILIGVGRLPINPSLPAKKVDIQECFSDPQYLPPPGIGFIRVQAMDLAGQVATTPDVAFLFGGADITSALDAILLLRNNTLQSHDHLHASADEILSAIETIDQFAEQLSNEERALALEALIELARSREDFSFRLRSPAVQAIPSVANPLKLVSPLLYDRAIRLVVELAQCSSAICTPESSRFVRIAAIMAMPDFEEMALLPVFESALIALAEDAEAMLGLAAEKAYFRMTGSNICEVADCTAELGQLAPGRSRRSPQRTQLPESWRDDPGAPLLWRTALWAQKKLISDLGDPFDPTDVNLVAASTGFTFRMGNMNVSTCSVAPEADTLVTTNAPPPWTCPGTVKNIDVTLGTSETVVENDPRTSTRFEDGWMSWEGSGTNRISIQTLKYDLDPKLPFEMEFLASLTSLGRDASVSFSGLGIVLTDRATQPVSDPLLPIEAAISDTGVHSFRYAYYPQLRSAWLWVDGEMQGQTVFGWKQ